MDSWTELDMLVQLTGAPYQTRRDALCQQPDLKQRLTPWIESERWPTRVTVRILTGWAEHADLYERVLGELDAVDPVAESRTAVGISRIWDEYAYKAREEYGPAILPLCWEALLKFNEQQPEWKTITFLHMIEAVPNPQSIDVLLWLIDRTDGGLRDVTARALMRQDMNIVKPRIEQAIKRHQEVARTLADALDIWAK